MLQTKHMFWDGANGKYTAERTDCPVYKGTEEGIFIETWSSAENSYDFLDFAFSQFEYDAGLVYKNREEHFKGYDFKPFGAIRLVLPPSFYDKMYARFIE